MKNKYAISIPVCCPAIEFAMGCTDNFEWPFAAAFAFAIRTRICKHGEGDMKEQHFSLFARCLPFKAGEGYMHRL